jgi:hypothetical protein
VGSAEFGYALGLVTESLIHNEAPAELGFMTVLGVEPIYECIGRYFQLENEIGALTFVTQCLRRYKLAHPATARLNSHLASATVSVYDDDRDVFLELSSPDLASLAAAYRALSGVTRVEIVESQSRQGYLFLLPRDNPDQAVLERAALAAVEAFERKGYVHIGQKSEGSE